MFQKYSENFAFLFIPTYSNLQFCSNLAVKFWFINKTLGLNNLKTKTAMNAKILVLVIFVERPYICRYIICMAASLRWSILQYS